MSPVKWLPTFQEVTVPSTSLSSCPICLSNIGMPNYLQEIEVFVCCSVTLGVLLRTFRKIFVYFLRFLDCLTLKMKTTLSYETSESATPPTRCHIPTTVRAPNIKPHNYLRLAQCVTSQKKRIFVNDYKSNQRFDVFRRWRPVLRSYDVWRHVVIRYTKTDVSGEVIVCIFSDNTCQY
jgi:hypothetical protein